MYMVSDMYKKKDAGAARAHISVFRKAEADIQTRRDRYLGCEDADAVTVIRIGERKEENKASVLSLNKKKHLLISLCKEDDDDDDEKKVDRYPPEDCREKHA